MRRRESWSQAGPETSTPVGTPGVVFLMDFCGQCRSCRLGYTNQCSAKRADMGFSHDGGYGPYELVHENVFFPVTPDVPLTEATMLLDVMGTGGHAIARAQLVRPDIESLLVAGAGPIGLGVLAMAKLLLGDDLPVYVADSIPYRLGLAERLGGIPCRARPAPAPGRRRHRHQRQRGGAAGGAWMRPEPARRPGLRRARAGAVAGRFPRSDRDGAGRLGQRIFPLSRIAGQPGTSAGAPGLFGSDHHAPLRRRRIADGV